jgi:uncharacterized protein YecT (DUF1311 family)
MICDSPELSRLDITMNKYYNFLLKQKISQQEIKILQKQWLQKRDEKCIDDSLCLKNSYTERLFNLTDKYFKHIKYGHFDFACIPDGSGMSMASCAQLRYKFASAYLNYKVNNLLDSWIDEIWNPSKSQIQASNHSWEEYAKDHCKIKGSWGGTMAPFVEYMCLTDKTKKRIIEIQSYDCHPSKC